jgi:hypothetical protein
MFKSKQRAVGWAMDALKLGIEPFLRPLVQPEEIAPDLLKITLDQQRTPELAPAPAAKAIRLMASGELYFCNIIFRGLTEHLGRMALGPRLFM